MATPTSPHRRALMAGGAFALAGGLATWWQRSGAAEPPPAPDGRPRRTGRAPALFIGHGSPLNALADNAFTRTLRQWGQQLGLPRAILVVSAHWLTEGETQVSVADKPVTIHDFGGFPRELFAQRYPAPGAPAWAQAAAQRLAPRRVATPQRGLDHGAWTVLKHLYPAADVPVFQWSIDITRDGHHHVAVGRALAALREQGVMILGSGNVVHNLRNTQRDAPDTPHGLKPWAEDFDQRVKQALQAHDLAALADYEALTPEATNAVPFPDHYYPLLTAAGAALPGEKAVQVFEGFQAGTLSMRCVQWG